MAIDMERSAVLPERDNPTTTPLRPGRIGLIAIYLVFAAVVFRGLAMESLQSLWPWYLGLELVYLVLVTLVFVKPDLPGGWLHLYFAFQSALILKLLSLQPEIDFVVILFAGLSYQVSLVFTGRVRWIWIWGLFLLTGGSLMFYLGALQGLALALTTMAGVIVLPAYVIVNREIETARARSQVLIRQLQQTHQDLQAYAGQVEELAAVQERNRLARELHDTVSQLIFSISLTTRSAQILLDQDQARVRGQLDCLKVMTGEALGELRALIQQLRPPQKL